MTTKGRPDAQACATVPGALWDEVEETDARFTKRFDRGQFKGTAVDAIYNVKRLSHLIGPVGFAWGWEIKSERLDTFGVGEDQQVIHSLVLEVWFRQPDGSRESVQHIGHTKASYWSRPRRPGDKPRFVVDDEFGKKSLTDALSKVMANLGASADIWLGRFDGNKYTAPSRDRDLGAEPEPDHHDLILHAGRVLEAIREASGREELAAAARQLKGTFEERPFWSQIVHADRELAAELQQAIRAKAPGFGLDLASV